MKSRRIILIVFLLCLSYIAQGQFKYTSRNLYTWNDQKPINGYAEMEINGNRIHLQIADTEYILKARGSEHQEDDEKHQMNLLVEFPNGKQSVIMLIYFKKDGESVLAIPELNTVMMDVKQISNQNSTTANSGSLDSIHSKYAFLEEQADICFDLRNWWGQRGGSSRHIHGKFIVSYSGFKKVAILYYQFDGGQNVYEYKMRVLDETSGIGKDHQSFYRQYIVQDVDNPSEKILVITSEVISKQKSKYVYLCSDPHFFDTTQSYMPRTGHIIMSASE